MDPRKKDCGDVPLLRDRGRPDDSMSTKVTFAAIDIHRHELAGHWIRRRNIRRIEKRRRALRTQRERKHK